MACLSFVKLNASSSPWITHQSFNQRPGSAYVLTPRRVSFEKASASGSYIDELGAREFVRVSRTGKPDDLLSSLIGGFGSGAILGRLQGLDIETEIKKHYLGVMDVVDSLFVAMFDSINENCQKELEAICKQYPFKPFKYLPKHSY